MKTHTAAIIVNLLFFASASFCQTAGPSSFSFNGFRLGMHKKDLGAMSPAMRHWKPVPMMDARKDEWDLTPKSLTAPTQPFPKLSGVYSDKPMVHGVKLSWTNGTLCKIVVDGPMTRSHAKARDWAAAAQEVLTASLGKPDYENDVFSDLTGEAMLEAVRKAGVASVLWTHARVSVFRWSDNVASEVFAGRMAPSFEVSVQKMNDIKSQ